MKHIPLLMKQHLVRQTIAGLKTQTMRMNGLGKVNECPDEWVIYDIDQPHAYTSRACFENLRTGEKFSGSSPYFPGNIIWVREAWQHAGPMLNIAPDDDNYGYVYRASDSGEDFEKNIEGWKWKPGIHMPKAAARLFLKITGARYHRVKEITQDQAKAEGAERMWQSAEGFHVADFATEHLLGECGDYYTGFKSLWDSIHGEPSKIQKRIGGKMVTTGYECYPFDENSPYLGQTVHKGKPLTVCVNPYVWAVEFERTGRPEDFLTTK